ncbi:MAG: UDP-N-acetylmuramate--L-alanine ligase [Gammaproteobacteria bacterium]
MHFFVLGIGGTLMSSVAILLRELGHQVSGCDQHLYEPVKSLLEHERIAVVSGYAAAQLPEADCYVVGNVVSRGNPMVERILREKRSFISAPECLHREILNQRQVIAVSGTHGKTSITALVAEILRQSGMDPGWLIGGVPQSDMRPAHLGTGPFVIEADEYDTAFFDKSAKFLHYRPDILLVNNLEFDHADIYADEAAIRQQFHRWIRILPDNAQVVVPNGSGAIEQLLQLGFWSQLHRLNHPGQGQTKPDAEADQWALEETSAGAFNLMHQGQKLSASSDAIASRYAGYVRENLLAALTLSVLAGADPTSAFQAATHFQGVKRRFERILDLEQVSIYDDFAHHPTAISACLKGARAQLEPDQKLLAVVDLASNTMAAGYHTQYLTQVAALADSVFWYGKSASETAEFCGGQAFLEVAQLQEAIVTYLRRSSGRCVVVLFSNSHFSGLTQTLPEAAGRVLSA